MAKDSDDPGNNLPEPIRNVGKHLTPEEKLKIDLWHTQGVSANQIAKRVGKNQTTISAYIRKTTPQKQKETSRLDFFRQSMRNKYLRLNETLVEKTQLAADLITEEELKALDPVKRASIIKSLSLPLGITFDKVDVLDNKGKSQSTLTLIIQQATENTLSPVEQEEQIQIDITPQDVDIQDK